MGKIKSIFLSCQPAVLQALMAFIINNPFLAMDFDDFINTNKLKNNNKNYNIVIIDDRAVKNEELNQLIVDVSVVNEVKKVVFTSKTDKNYFNLLTNFCIDGIISAKEELSVLEKAVVKVYEGEKYFSEFINKITNSKITDYD